MKKIFALILTIVIVFSFVGCAGSNTENTGDNINNDNAQTNDFNNAPNKEPTNSACSHSWAPATCTEAARCTVCGEHGGSALGHKYGTATCTAPSKCTVCGATNGSAAGHKWSNATCQTPKKCTTCGITEGNVGNCTDSGNGKCTYCGKDVFLNNIKNKLTVQLIVPSVGASNNYYFQVKFVNHTGSPISLAYFTTANGKLCNNSEAKGYQLASGYEVTVPYYNALIPSERHDAKYKNMYLDNSSLANTTIEINGKTVHIKFGTNGITDIGYSLQEIGVY